VWTPSDPEQLEQAKERLEVWPLDEYNAKLLNEVHPLGYTQSSPKPHEVYDLIGTYCMPYARQQSLAFYRAGIGCTCR
jgi:hypothetical protein